MQDQSLFTSSQPQGGISENLQRFIDAMVEEIVLEGKPFDTQKKYLKKFSENEGLNYDKLEADITTFIEILDSLKTAFSKLQVKLAEEKGRECHISEETVKKLVGHSHVKEIVKSNDGSILSRDSKKDSSYLNEVVMAVCIGGDCYSKFNQDVIRYFGEETNEKILRFLNELGHRRFVGGSKKLTETYKLSLIYLGKDIGLEDKTIKEIIEWQQKRLTHDGYDIMLLLVVATNSSMKELNPQHITKEEFVVNEIRDLISNFKGYIYDYWNNLTLSIITYDTIAHNHMWPTRLQNIDENKIDIKTTEENTVCISEGLESALRIAQMHVGKTYMVLVSDGQDDDVEKTKKVIDAIMHKRSIEFYTYFVDSLTYQNVSTTKRSAFCSIGGIPLSTPIVETLDRWVTRDVSFHPWYEQESWYEQELIK